MNTTMTRRLIFFLVLFTYVSSKSLPPEIEKCSLSGPNLATCMAEKFADGLKKFKNGNKELSIIPLEPVVVPKIEFGNTTSGSVSIQQEYENFKVYGMSNSKVFDSEIDLSDENCFWRFKSRAPEIVMEADYKMTGRLLVFPINGHGKCKNTLYDCSGTYDIKCEKYLKKGKKHIRVTSLKSRFEPKTVVFDFENIIDGNEELSREVLKTLNENALAIFADVGPDFDSALGEIFKDIVNRVFSRVSEDELFLP